MIGYIFGLAPAQCLFYALLRLEPRAVRVRAGTWEPVIVAVIVGLEAVTLAFLPILLNRSGSWYDVYGSYVLQAGVMLLPALPQLVSVSTIFLSTSNCH